MRQELHAEKKHDRGREGHCENQQPNRDVMAKYLPGCVRKWAAHTGVEMRRCGLSAAAMLFINRWVGSVVLLKQLVFVWRVEAERVQ
jgi:hypothetical protein